MFRSKVAGTAIDASRQAQLWPLPLPIQSTSGPKGHCKVIYCQLQTALVSMSMKSLPSEASLKVNLTNISSCKWPVTSHWLSHIPNA